MPLTQVFLDIVDLRPAARRRSSQRVCLASASPARRRGPAPARRRASRSRESSTPAHCGASQRIVFSSENRFRSSTLARLSVPTATLHARLVEPLDRRIADADPLIAARAGHERRADRRQARQRRIVELHAVHDQRLRRRSRRGDRDTHRIARRNLPSRRATRRSSRACRATGRCPSRATRLLPPTRRDARS